MISLVVFFVYGILLGLGTALTWWLVFREIRGKSWAMTGEAVFYARLAAFVTLFFIPVQAYASLETPAHTDVPSIMVPFAVLFYFGCATVLIEIILRAVYGSFQRPSFVRA